MGKGLGFRVFSEVARPAKELVERFRGASVANIGDAMGRFRIMDYRIKSINKPGVSMVGTAITVRVRPGDNLMIHKALNIAEPGDVIAVEVQGSPLSGLWGELMAAYAQSRGIEGLVMDGGVRDSLEIREMGFPVFTRAVIAAGGDKDGPGEVNVPITCGGVPVFPGDILVGNDDGVAVVPRADAEGVLETLEAIQANELRKMEAIRQGKSDRSWVDETLRKKGCIEL